MNLGAVYVEPSERSCFYPHGYAVMSCEMVDGEQRHCVVALDGERVWDPSPKERKILRSGIAWTILIILDPSKPTNKEVYSR